MFTTPHLFSIMEGRVMAMTFTQGFLLVASMLIILLMAIHAFRKRQRKSALAFFLLMVFALFWSFTSFMEEIVTDDQALLWWRNLQQIGVFGTPIISLFFAIRYTGRERWMSYAYGALIIQITAVALILTDGWHHLMRSTVTVIDHALYGPTLIVQSTPLGLALVTFNFMLSFAAFILLVDFRRKTEVRYRKQISIIIWSFVLVFLAAFLKMAFFNNMGLYLSISVLYIPGALLLFYGLFRHDFLMMSPMGRDMIFSIIDNGVIITDRNKNIMDINPRAKQWVSLYFQNHPDIIGKNIDHLFSSLIHDFNIFTSADENVFEVIITRPKETYLSIHRIPIKQGRKIHSGFVYIISDVTRDKEYQRKLEYMATHDRLTGLTNRISFETRYEEINADAPHTSMILLDIDDFKQINDVHGHGFGDLVLEDLARALKNSIGTHATIGRLGGEEFGIIVSESETEDTFRSAEDIRRNVEQRVMQSPVGGEVRYTVSLGVAVTDRVTPFDDLRNRADQALYEAKKTGKNKTIMYDA